MRVLAVVAALALAGCQSASIFGGSTGILPVGPDTYMLTENAILSLGGGVTAQGNATRSANDYCISQGRQILVTNAQTTPQGGSVSYSLTFRCLAASDPSLRPPVYRAEPNVVIQTR